MVTATRGESIADAPWLAYNSPMNIPGHPITTARLQSDLAALNAIGRDPVSGVLARPAGSAAANAAQEWLRRRVAAADLEYLADDEGFTIRAPAVAGTPVVIAGDILAVAGAGPFDGALALVLGLEILRSLPPTGSGVALGNHAALLRSARCVFHCVALHGSMLTDSARQLGVALSDTAPLSMRRACEIAQSCGVAVLPVPLAATGMAGDRFPACVLVFDAALNRWPPDESAWSAVTACAGLLLELVRDVAAG